MKTLAELSACLELSKAHALTELLLAQKVTAITCDSRQVTAGGLFVALRGAKADGHAFIPQAVQQGCLVVVVESELAAETALPVPALVVRDSHAALCALAAAWYDYPARELTLIGVTGTNGKTTCTWLIEGMLVANGYRPGILGTVNYRYHGAGGLQVLCDAPLTTPDPVSMQRFFRVMADQGVTHVVMEVSSHALEQNRLGDTRFDVALFTNLSRDHLDYHQTMERYFAAKQLLFQRYLHDKGLAVVVTEPSADGLDWGKRIAAMLPQHRVICCGLGRDAAVTAVDLQQHIAGFQCTLSLEGRRYPFTSPLTGRYNVLNILTAAGAGLALGLRDQEVCSGLAGIGDIPGRLERVSLSGAAADESPAVFVDYAHTPDALENVLRTLQGLTSGRLICIVGCGGDRDRGKRPLMGNIAGQHADVIVITSDNPRTEDPQAIVDAIAEGAAASGKRLVAAAELWIGAQNNSGYMVLPDRRLAIHTGCGLARPGDTVLIAGKGHETYQIVGTERRFFDDRLEARDALATWNVRHLLAATGGRLVSGQQGGLLGRISTDSREIEPGDVFLALRGEQFDGHEFIEKAMSAGAAAIIGESLPTPTSDQSVLLIQVDDSLKALGCLAAYRRQLFGNQVQVAAVTGSSGKTTVKEMIAAIFSAATAGIKTGVDPVLKTRGNFNNLIGLPLSLLPLQAGHRLAALEMGMNAPGEIARLVGVADPDIGCINNIQPAHLLGLGSIEGVARAKGELFAGMRPDAIRVVNCDDVHVRKQAQLHPGAQVGFAVTRAGRRQHPQVWTTRALSLGERGMRFTLHIGTWSQRLNVPVPGFHNVSNCAAAAAVAHAAGIAPECIVTGLLGYKPVDKRMVASVLPGDLQVVNDAYNANPASMAAGLRTVAGFGGSCRHFAALGDMLELGNAAQTEHEKIGRLVGSLQYNWLAVTGTHAETVARAALAAGMKDAQVRVFNEPKLMADWICQLLAESQLTAGDWLLVKGSRGMRMELLLEELQQRLQSAFTTQC